jgi:AraC-like DNA-binding protein
VFFNFDYVARDFDNCLSKKLCAKLLSIFVLKYPKSANNLKLKNHNNITFLHLEFDDFETFRDAAARWSLDFKQLDSGSFIGDISLLDSQKIQIGTTTLNRKLDQRGITPNGYRTFIVPKQKLGGSYIWRGYEVSENELLIQPKTREFASITNPGWGIYTISIAEDLVVDFFEDFGPSEFLWLSSTAEVMKLSSNLMNRLRRQLDYIFDLAKQNASNIKKKAFRQIFFEGIPWMVLNYWVSNKLTENVPSSRIRDVAFRKAIGYLNSCTTEMPTIKELCLISGASERTLQNAFKEKYGFGPKEFIRKHKLNLVRKELLQNKSSTVKVQDIAHRYGFLHLGHFGADYKKLFKESPSETILKGSFTF